MNEAKLYKTYTDGNKEYFVGAYRVFEDNEDGDKAYRCSCPGFFYKGTCSHISEVVASQIVESILTEWSYAVKVAKAYEQHRALVAARRAAPKAKTYKRDRFGRFA